MKYVLHHAEQAHAVVLAARNRVLAAHASATNQVDAVVALEPGHRVDERQRLDGEAESDELFAQSLETLQLVANASGALELEALARRDHLLPQRGFRTVVAAIEK